MKLKSLLNIILEDVDPDAMASANALIFVEKIKNAPDLMKALQQLKMPTDKYKAIVIFAGLLGIPEERFDDFIANMKNKIYKDTKTEER